MLLSTEIENRGLCFVAVHQELVMKAEFPCTGLFICTTSTPTQASQAGARNGVLSCSGQAKAQSTPKKASTQY
jgi:hypothetical protein